MSYRLAIVIPAYKRTYLDATLTSIAAQTCKNFNVYICDDNSPYELREVIAKYRQSIDIKYVKYEKNLGSSSLVKHWERSISEIEDEDWIWLFSDDDLMHQDCVKLFYENLKEFPNQDLFRFDLKKINNEGHLIGETVEYNNETGLEYASAFLDNQRFSTVVEYIFSRKIYEQKGGFVELPAAWGSDIATWINFSLDKTIITIANCEVYWRLSGENISSRSDLFKSAKFEADIQFMKWIVHLKDEPEWKVKVKKWYTRRLEISDIDFSINTIIRISLLLSKYLNTNVVKSFFYLFLFHYRLGLMIRLKMEKLPPIKFITTWLRKSFL